MTTAAATQSADGATSRHALHREEVLPKREHFLTAHELGQRLLIEASERGGVAEGHQLHAHGLGGTKPVSTTVFISSGPLDIVGRTVTFEPTG